MNLVGWIGDMIVTPIGKVIALILFVVSSFSIWLVAHDHKIASKAEATTIAKVEKGARELNAKGIKARAAADRPGAAQRLRKSDCRDC